MNLATSEIKYLLSQTVIGKRDKTDIYFLLERNSRKGIIPRKICFHLVDCIKHNIFHVLRLIPISSNGRQSPSKVIGEWKAKLLEFKIHQLVKHLLRKILVTNTNIFN